MGIDDICEVYKYHSCLFFSTHLSIGEDMKIYENTMDNALI